MATTFNMDASHTAAEPADHDAAKETADDAADEDEFDADLAEELEKAMQDDEQSAGTYTVVCCGIIQPEARSGTEEEDDEDGENTGVCT